MSVYAPERILGLVPVTLQGLVGGICGQWNDSVSLGVNRGSGLASRDKEGAEPPLSRIVVERIPDFEPRRFYVLSADIEAHGLTGGCPGLCSAGITWKSEKTTQQRVSRTNQNDYREYLDG